MWELHYTIIDSKYIINVLISMKDTIDQDAVKNFTDIWSKLGR